MKSIGGRLKWWEKASREIPGILDKIKRRDTYYFYIDEYRES